VSTRTILDRYRTSASYLARVLHRLSGLLLTIYVLVYIWELGSVVKWDWEGGALLRDTASFDAAMASYNTTFWHITHALVIALLALHALTGLRVLMFEAGVGLKIQRASFWISLLLSTVLFILLFIKVMTKL
jgi:succinate dehydrogenase / fumarate reductase, cytochrome b subunit